MKRTPLFQYLTLVLIVLFCATEYSAVNVNAYQQTLREGGGGGAARGGTVGGGVGGGGGGVRVPLPVPRGSVVPRVRGPLKGPRPRGVQPSNSKSSDQAVRGLRNGKGSVAHTIKNALRGGAIGGVAPRVIGQNRESFSPRGGTYTLRNPSSGKVKYVGRSNDLQRRQLEHFRDPQKKGLDFRVDRRTNSSAAQRGREQILYERHQPPLNKVRPISPNNKNIDMYMREGKKLK